MHIQNGKLYENRTWKYLYPCLKFYGETLTNYLSSFFKLAVGIGDSNVTLEGNCIYILIDTNVPKATESDRNKYRNSFAKFLDYLKYQHFYVSDYVFEQLAYGEKHMIVLKMPPVHDMTYISFVRGEYSKMYTKKDIDFYFNILPNEANNQGIAKRNLRVRNSRLVFQKDKSLLPAFVKRVIEDYKADVTIQDFADAELDYPVNLKEEIFNYRGE